MADPMAKPKKPGLAALVLSASKPALGEDDDDTTADGSEESDEDYSGAVDELFDALKGDDRAGFAESFKAAVMSCKH